MSGIQRWAKQLCHSPSLNVKNEMYAHCSAECLAHSSPSVISCGYSKPLMRLSSLWAPFDFRRPSEAFPCPHCTLLYSQGASLYTCQRYPIPGCLWFYCLSAGLGQEWAQGRGAFMKGQGQDGLAQHHSGKTGQKGGRSPLTSDWMECWDSLLHKRNPQAWFGLNPHPAATGAVRPHTKLWEGDEGHPACLFVWWPIDMWFPLSRQLPSWSKMNSVHSLVCCLNV